MPMTAHWAEYYDDLARALILTAPRPLSIRHREIYEYLLERYRQHIMADITPPTPETLLLEAEAESLVRRTA